MCKHVILSGSNIQWIYYYDFICNGVTNRVCMHMLNTILCIKVVVNVFVCDHFIFKSFVYIILVLYKTPLV